MVALVSVGSIRRRRQQPEKREVCEPHSTSLLLPAALPGTAQALPASMALIVHLKTVSELRGRSDRITKVTFRGREAPVSGEPQVCKLTQSIFCELIETGEDWEEGWQSSSRHSGLMCLA